MKRYTIKQIEAMSSEEFDKLPEEDKRRYYDWMDRDNLPESDEYTLVQIEGGSVNLYDRKIYEQTGDLVPLNMEKPRPKDDATSVKEEEIIFAYTRKQAIEDGVLFDVGDLAKEAGFRFHVAMTSAAYEKCVRVPEGVTGQDETGRLWDVLTVLRWMIRQEKASTDQVLFLVLVNNGKRTQGVNLKSLCGPDDDGSPCITIMLPDED